jgi:hypothetical protein
LYLFSLVIVSCLYPCFLFLILPFYKFMSSNINV